VEIVNDLKCDVLVFMVAGNVNFARRAECNRCKAPKPKSEASGKAGAKAGGKAGGKAGDKESRKRPRDAAAAADSSSGKRAKAVGGGKQPAGAAAAQSAGSPGEADEQAKEKESSTEQKSKEEELNALKLDTTGPFATHPPRIDSVTHASSICVSGFLPGYCCLQGKLSSFSTFRGL